MIYFFTIDLLMSQLYISTSYFPFFPQKKILHLHDNLSLKLPNKCKVQSFSFCNVVEYKVA